VFTFTATEPLCSSGTFEDDVRVAVRPFRAGTGNLLVRTTYTCTDGSGTFDMLKHIFLTFGEEDDFTNTGPVQIVGGTGDYEGIVGHGVDVGTSDGSTGVGTITGFVALAHAAA
jgi:hypothetical protein